MKMRILFAALGLAAAILVFGQTSAKADHCRSGYGSGYGGGYYGGIGGTSVYRVAPNYGYGYGNYGSYYRGYGHHHHHDHGYYGGHYGHGRGRSIQVRTPGFSFGLYR